MVLLFALAAAMGATPPALAQDKGPEEEASSSLVPGERSPWLLAPVFNSNPKLGVSAGALAGYIHYFDAKSRPSIFAVQGQYSNTDSIVGAVIGRTSFDEDRQRVIAGLIYGNIKNDYSDYLGTGVPLQSNSEIRQFIGRYLYRIKDNWFIGAQGLYQNFVVGGESAFDDQVLDILGVQPYKSGGAGVVVYHDSRDREDSPTKGWLFSMSNVAYRESLGGDNDFDVYRIDYRYFMTHGKGNVFALRQLNHLTHDAPTVARAPVQLRGYKIGQYNADYMSQIEGEERFRLGERWTATLFLGIACTYGAGKDCSDSANLFPNAGAGVQYVIKPKEGIVMNLEYAQGKDGNHGVYLKMGYGF